MIRYGDDGSDEKLDGSRRGDWRAIRDAGPTDTIIIIPPSHVAPTICHCEHADCADAPPGFTTIQDLEYHHIQEHSAPAAGGEAAAMAAIFKPTEDALTPAWRRKDADSFEHSQIRGEQAAHIAKDIIPVSAHLSHTSFGTSSFLYPLFSPLSFSADNVAIRTQLTCFLYNHYMFYLTLGYTLN